MSDIIYNLTENVPNFNSVIINKNSDDKYINIHKYTTKFNEEYHIVKYSKEILSSSLYSTYGLLRSIILSRDWIVSFAPPKSLTAENFMEKYPEINNDIVAQEFIEGTMINVFFDPNYGASGCWQISTRNTVGAYVTFYTWSKKTFNQMFMEACIYCNFNIQMLNPAFVYSFVLQHPDNRIVCPIKNPALYLIAIYEIHNIPNKITINEKDITTVIYNGMWQYTGVQFPKEFKFSSYSELINTYASPNTQYDIMGIIVKNKVTGERTKFRNPIHEEIRYLRGNQPKLLYQYLTLRSQGKVSEYLKYYPEMRNDFSSYRDQVHMFTETLHKNYISCYVKKEKPLNQFSDQYRTHMFKLHENYLTNLREKGLFITNTVVIEYVNKMHPSLMMYCLNYNMRKRFIDSVKL
jgi:hypothetical protein